MTPEEVAAVTAVTVALQQREDAAATAAAHGSAADAPLSAWVDASRRSAQRALMQRGSWRLSSRIGRRSRT